MMFSSRQPPTACELAAVYLLVVGVSAALPAAVPSTAVVESPLSRLADRRLPPMADGDGRRGRRRTATHSGDVRTMFGGIEDERRRRRLAELADLDIVAAVLEYNEMVLTSAAGNGSETSNTCLMRLNYNVTASPGGFTDLFRDQAIA